MEKIESFIREALSRSQASSKSERDMVYKKALSAILKLARNNDSFPVDVEDKVGAIIEKIESEFETPMPISAASEIAASPASISPEPKNSFQKSDPQPRRIAKPASLFIALLLGAAIGFAIGLLQKDIFSTGSILIDANFENLDKNFSAVGDKFVLASDQEISTRTDAHEGKPTLVVKGQGYFYVRNPVRVDPEKTYRVSIMMRVLPGESKQDAASTYVGLATYDSNGVYQKSPPGADRYGVVRQAVKSTVGWQVYEGIFTGAGDGDHNQFRVGTVFAKPVVLFNFRAPANVETEFAWIKMEEVTKD